MKQDDYKAAFEEAKEAACDALEHEARRRAMEGVRRYKFTKSGQPIKHPETGEHYYEHVYSDTLLIFLLKGAKPEKYADQHRIRHDAHVTGKGAVLVLPANGTEAVQIVEDEMWYGNKSHALARAQISAQKTDSPAADDSGLEQSVTPSRSEA